MIGVVDYEAGNIASVRNALDAVGARHEVSCDPALLERCDGIILPGVGAAPGAMASLEKRGLTGFLQRLEKPLLGICLGMQILFESSEEGETPCLGILPGRIRRLPAGAEKIPHMGWSPVTFTGSAGAPGKSAAAVPAGGNRHPLWNGIDAGAYFYFAHSFVAQPPDRRLTIGVAECGGEPFTAALSLQKICGVQFHPEKSGNNGLTLLKNFEILCRSYRQ